MIACPSCGGENVEGTRFCVKCGTTLPVTPQPGSWQQPSGGLNQPGSAGLNQPSGGFNQPSSGFSQPSGGLNQSGGGFNQPGAYTPPPVAAPTYGYPSPPGTLPAPGGATYALWADRVIAALIDGALIFAGIIVLYMVVALIGGIGSAALGAVSRDAGGLFGTGACCTFFVLPPIAALIVSLYNKIYLIGSRGYSIGQGLMGLKVLMADGSPVPMNTSVIRFLVQFGLGIVPFVGWLLTLLNLLFPLWDPQRQTLHDKAVGTVVIKR